SWLGVLDTSNLPSLTISHAHPLPKRVAPAVLNLVLNSSKLPNAASMAAASFPEGLPPALGARISQKKLWFQCPPPLLRTAGLIVPAAFTSSSRDLFSLGVPAIALLRLST